MYGNFKYQQLRNLGISQEKALQMAAFIRVSSFEESQVIWSKGSKVDAWQFIISGLVSASLEAPTGQMMPISIYGEGSWFGEQSIINRKASYADFVCLSTTEVMGISSDIVLELMETQPAFALYLTRLMAWRVQKTSETLMLMKFGNPCLRVVMGLSQFAEALNYHSDRPPTIGFGQGVEIPVKQKTLADLCGVSRTVFSEHVQKLAAKGWLSISYGRLEILSLPNWQRFSNKQRARKFNDLNPSFEELLSELAAE
ncbi:Crp/Fnr family transcriptional regulator [Rhodoferax sp. GW822-FHT02A01]|uniref:Crp/Fnr family transcriptional regulator n=1 Tax=Rhodoferax sp. GW822-FHT02A01 TaxID=3141537 RepID=UPI00315DCA4C